LQLLVSGLQFLELASPLRVEVLSEHYGRGKVFVKRADQRRKRTTARGRTHYHEIVALVSRYVISHD